jgi:hypothetical protein
VQLIAFFRLHTLEVTVLTGPLAPSEALESGKRVVFFMETVRGKFNFNARDSEDLSFHKGDLMNVIEKHEAEWWKAQNPKSLEIGVIPAPYVKIKPSKCMASALHDIPCAFFYPHNKPISSRGCDYNARFAT